MSDDTELLRRYAEEGSEQAFGELVERYVGLVYSAAIRRVGSDAQLAQDVAQTVFSALARKARVLSTDVVLGGWLYRHACLAAAQTVRSERRRRVRESEAAVMNALNIGTDPDWSHLAPFLDEAIQRLGARDRDAIVLRYFERRDLRGVGSALGLSEEAARKRVSRALDKLKVFFKRRGLNLSTSVLVALLTGHAVTAAPAGAAASISGAALASVAVGGGTVTLLKIMTMTKFKFGVISVIAVAGVATPLVLQHQSLGELRQENRALETQNQQLGPLSAANERLTNLLAQAQQVQSLSDQQLHELLRLRGEVGLLRKDSQDLAKLRAKRNEPPASAANPAAPGQTQMLTADSWADVGMDTPDAALQTFFWAARHNNADVVGKLIRWQKDASVPDFDGLDNIVTNFIPATLQFASEVQGLRILSRSEENEATARVQVEFAADGNQAAKTAEVQFVKEDTQWKPVLHVWSPHQGSIRGGLGIPSKPEN